MVGATLALLLAQRARIDPGQILLIEPEPAATPPPGAPYELRVSALSPGNRQLLVELGVWRHVDASRVAPYERMVVWQESIPPDSPDVLRFDAAELGEPDLGCIIENRNLQGALLARCAALGILPRRAALTALRLDADAARLSLGDEQVEAGLVVGADGAASPVRRFAGVAVRQLDYGQQGIVATVRGERGHCGTAWQRFLSTGPLALLPLASGECSIVWSARNARAAELMALPAESFAAALTEASAGVLGRLALTSARAVFPLKRVTAETYALARCALVGDAAHVIHPLAGQGVNQGLQDAVALAEALEARPPRESVGATAALQRYARQRRGGNALMGTMVDGLDRLFTGSPGPVAWAAQRGMGLLGRSAAAKRFFFTRAAADRSSPRR